MSLNTFWLNNSLCVSAALQWKQSSQPVQSNPVLQMAAKIANALDEFGIAHQEAVASLVGHAIDSHALLWAVTGYGAQYHALDPNSPVELLVREINHHQSAILFIEPQYLPLLTKIRPLLIYVELIILVGSSDDTFAANSCHSFDEFISGMDTRYHWPDIAEDANAIICYEQSVKSQFVRSCYTHRQMLIMALTALSYDTVRLSASDRIIWGLPIYESKGWVIPLACLVTGAPLEIMKRAELLLQIKAFNPSCLFMPESEYSHLVSELNQMTDLPKNLSVMVSTPTTNGEGQPIAHRQTISVVSKNGGRCQVSTVFNWSGLMSGDPMVRPVTQLQQMDVPCGYIFPAHGSIM